MAAPQREVTLNPTKRLLEQGGFSLMFSVRQTASANIALAAKAAGFDCLYVDMEHGSVSMQDAGQIFVAALAAGITPFVRLPEGGTHDTQLALDLGAMGIVVPHVHSAADAERAVRRCKYPPVGTRANCTDSPQQLVANIATDDLPARLEKETMVLAMIESKAGLENVESIAAVAGIDVLFVATGDLCLELGIIGQFDNEIIFQAFERAVAAARKHGKHVCVGGGIKRAPPATLKALREMGVRQLSVGNDSMMLLAAMRHRVAEINEAVRN